MSKLDEIRDKKVDLIGRMLRNNYDNKAVLEEVKQIFDSAISLELPVLFAEYVIKNVDTYDSEDGAYYFQGQWRSIGIIYSFWLNNIYKP